MRIYRAVLVLIVYTITLLKVEAQPTYLYYIYAGNDNCLQGNGRIDIHPNQAQSNTFSYFPLPYTLGVKKNGVETYYEMATSSYSLTNLVAGSYEVTIYLSERCKYSATMDVLSGTNLILPPLRDSISCTNGNLLVLDGVKAEYENNK